MHDQTSFWAAIATIVVWVAITAISIVFLVMMAPDAVLAALFMLSMAGIGVAGTHVVWDSVVKLRKTTLNAERYRRGEGSNTSRSAAAQRKAKRERDGRLDRLIEQLDEDEVIELESLLMSRGVDGPD